MFSIPPNIILHVRDKLNFYNCMYLEVDFNLNDIALNNKLIKHFFLNKVITTVHSRGKSIHAKEVYPNVAGRSTVYEVL